EELRHAVIGRRADHVRRDGEVLVEEVGLSGRVGNDAADFRGSEHYAVDALVAKERMHLPLVQQIQFVARARHDILEAVARERAKHGATGKPTVACDVNAISLVHSWISRAANVDASPSPRL